MVNTAGLTVGLDLAGLFQPNGCMTSGGYMMDENFISNEKNF